MANDRLYLRCNKCKQTLLLWKHYPAYDGFVFGDIYIIDDWFVQHIYECDGRDDFGVQSPVSIITEATKAEEEESAL